MVLTNETAARKYWKTATDAVGARVRVWGDERTVAGVVGDVRDMPWHATAEPALYYPQAQTWYRSGCSWWYGPSARHQRWSSRSAARFVKSIRHCRSPTSPHWMRSRRALSTRRLTLSLVAVFGITALLLAVVGIYGVIAQSVGHRTQEFGVRLALGATQGDILRLVLTSGAVVIAGGVAAGLLLSAAATRLLDSLLYGVSAADLSTFVSVTMLLIASALLATYIPARRATRISAAAAMRTAEYIPELRTCSLEMTAMVTIEGRCMLAPSAMVRTSSPPVEIDRREFLTAIAAAGLVPRGLARAAAGWQAGVATIDITPDKSLWMAGFAARTEPSQGVAMPLHAKALALKCGEQPAAVLVTVDLLGVTDRHDRPRRLARSASSSTPACKPSLQCQSHPLRPGRR